MLWRAGSGHKQLLPLALHFIPRWPIASLTVQYSSHVKMENVPHPSPKFTFTGRIPRTLLSKFTIETSSLLVAIEEIVPTDMSRDEILQRLRPIPLENLKSSATVCKFAQEVVQKSCPDRAIHVLHISHRLGIALAHNQYEQVVYRLATHEHWSQVYTVAAMAEKHTGRWTARLLNWVIRSHLETQQYALLDDVLDLFKRDRLLPSRRTYHHLIRGQLQNADLMRARKSLAQMRDAGFEANKSTYLTVLGAYRSLGPNEAVEQQAFQTVQGKGDSSDTIILNALMQLRIDDGDLAGALRILGLFALPPISHGGRDGNGTQAARTPSTSSPSAEPGALPDIATFNIILGFLAQKEGKLQDTLSVFAQIQAAGLRVDVETVAALIRAYFTANMPEAAVAIVAEMCKFHNLSVDLDEFQRLGYRTELLGDEILYARSVFPTMHIFNIMLRGVLVKHGLLGMRWVFRIMRQAALTPDSSTTHIILSYLHRIEHVRPRSLIGVLRTLSTLRNGRTILTIQHVNTIIQALLRRERDIVRTKSWNATAQRVRFGHRSRFSPGRLSPPSRVFDPTAGISLASFRSSVRKPLEPVIQTLLDRQVMSDRISFGLSIRRNAVIRMDMDSAWHVFNTMVARGIRPDAYHFSALMEGYVSQRNMDNARKVMDSAAQSGVAPNVVMYTILIIGYGRMGRPDLAMRTFSEMKAAGVDPDFAAIDAVASAYWFVREYRTARKVLLELWSLVAPFPPDLEDAPLRVLVRAFRALRPEGTVTHSSDSPRERPRRLLVKRKLARAFAELKKREPVHIIDSASWAKEHVPLNPMLQVDVSGRSFD